MDGSESERKPETSSNIRREQSLRSDGKPTRLFPATLAPTVFYFGGGNKRLIKAISQMLEKY